MSFVALTSRYTALQVNVTKVSDDNGHGLMMQFTDTQTERSINKIFNGIVYRVSRFLGMASETNQSTVSVGQKIDSHLSNTLS